MALRLTLVRHAKSSWKDAQLADFDRPLNARGRADGPRIAAWLRGNSDARPQHILVSPARRTRETADALLPALAHLAPTVDFEAQLYHADADTLMTLVQRTPSGCDALMLIGHNPGLTDLANRLAHETVHPDLPTLAVVTLEFATSDWRVLRPGSARLVSLMSPKLL